MVQSLIAIKILFESTFKYIFNNVIDEIIFAVYYEFCISAAVIVRTRKRSEV